MMLAVGRGKRCLGCSGRAAPLQEVQDLVESQSSCLAGDARPMQCLGSAAESDGQSVFAEAAGPWTAPDQRSSSGKDLAGGQSGERWLARSSLGSAGNRGMQGAAAASIMIAGAWFAWLCTLSHDLVGV